MRMRFRLAALCSFLFLFSLLLSSCSSPLRAAVAALVLDYSTPRITASFSGHSSQSKLFTDNCGIAADSNIILVFSETMDTDSLSISGSAAEECGGAWSQTESANDTLTLSPKGAWSAGSGKTITVACSDFEAYPAEEFSVTFGVLSGTVYVHATAGSASAPGTSDEPLSSIASAVDLAAYLYTSAEVHVAEGTYTISSPVSIRDGISLYGGYSADDWAVRETDELWAVSGDLGSAYPTILSGANVDFVLYFSGIGAGTAVDGFQIDAGTGDSTDGCYLSASSPVLSGMKIGGGLGTESTALVLTASSDAVIRGCNIDGGSNGWSGGILVSESSPVITGCIIDGGTSGTGSFTFGLYLSGSAGVLSGNEISGGSAWNQATAISLAAGSDPVIFNNLIDGGYSQAGATTGVFCSASGPVIRNNTVCGGNSAGPDAGEDGVEGLNIVNSSTASVDNNIIFTTAGLNRIGILADSGSDPASLKNNNIFDCPTALYSRETTVQTDYTSVAGFEAALGSAASGNVSRSGIFIDQSSDLHLAAAADVDVRQGGLDGSALGWSFSTDMDGNNRTNSTAGGPSNTDAGGWSMGAYEKD